MTFLTGLALKRRSVTILVIILVLLGGIISYRNLPVELFPEIEFPLVTISTPYPSANPESVVTDVTQPIENAISGTDGLTSTQSISSEGLSLVFANFKFGTDMAEAERTIQSNVGAIQLIDGARDPRVARINPDAFPVLQLSVLGDKSQVELQEISESLIIPAITAQEGVLSVELSGGRTEEVIVTVDPAKLEKTGISLFQVAGVLQNNNVTFPTGTILDGDQRFLLRATSQYNGLSDIKSLIIGIDQESPIPKPIIVSDIATVSIGSSKGPSISRTNGKPSIGISVIKEPEANTVNVTRSVLARLGEMSLPEDTNFVVISNDGPEIQSRINQLEREAILGFLFAVAVVFAFLITRKPKLLSGLSLTLRPTAVIALSIPLSVFTGILLMNSQGLSLNFMTLGGLAISIGRVVDDSIVVLENVYRHIQRGGDRFGIPLTATKEVAPAIFASTLTTIVVFLPLAFIQGLVGAFFLPFAITLSFALVASLIVALTVVPVLGALLLRPGDIPSTDLNDSASLVEFSDEIGWMQRAYMPILGWALTHKAITLIVSGSLAVGSLGLLTIIPLTLFSSDGERLISIDVQVPSGTSLEKVAIEAAETEALLTGLLNKGDVAIFQTTIGQPDNPFTASGPGAGAIGLQGAKFLVRLTDTAPSDLSETLRAALPSTDARTISIDEVSTGGPPTGELEVKITGNDYAAITDVAQNLVQKFSLIDGVVNVESDVADARKEIVIDVDPRKAAMLGLSARDVALQINQFFVGRQVTQATIDGSLTGVVLQGRPESVSNIESVRQLTISGRNRSATVGSLATVRYQDSPVRISRTDGQRSASISGTITAEDTNAVGGVVQALIDDTPIPEGITVQSGGVFQQMAEGFQDIFYAIGAGLILVYLVMVASLGSLRNPFIIVMSLPLAVIGALVALAVTDRTLGFPGMMGFLLLVGLVLTNAIVLIAFVEQLKERGLGTIDALTLGGRIRLRPILMTAFTTTFALIPLAFLGSDSGGILSAELATVVIGGLASSTFLTLVVVPVVYVLMHQSIPEAISRIRNRGESRSLPK